MSRVRRSIPFAAGMLAGVALTLLVLHWSASREKTGGTPSKYVPEQILYLSDSSDRPLGSINWEEKGISLGLYSSHSKPAAEILRFSSNPRRAEFYLIEEWSGRSTVTISL